MDRHLLALATGFAVIFLGSGAALAQVPAQSERQGGAVAPERPSRPARERWRDLSPEDRQRFRSNAEKWRQMEPEERREWRARQDFRRQRIKREADQALRESGLQLEADKRDLYELRYLQERRRIEQALRQELEEKRRRELAPVVERLKREFSEPHAPSGPSPK